MYCMYVRVAVPSELRTEESCAAIENIFGAAGALPSASHHPVSQRLQQPGLRSRKCDFVQTLQPVRCFEFCVRTSAGPHSREIRNVRAGAASVFSRFPVEVAGRDSGASTAVRPIRQVAV